MVKKLRGSSSFLELRGGQVSTNPYPTPGTEREPQTKEACNPTTLSHHQKEEQATLGAQMGVLGKTPRLWPLSSIRA